MAHLKDAPDSQFAYVVVVARRARQLLIGGRPMVERFGGYVLLSRRDLDLVEHFFNKYGSITVLVGRMLPIVRTFIALPAGIAKMNQLRFHIYTFLGSWPWCLALAYAGFLLGTRWDSDPALRSLFHEFDALVAAVLLAGFGWFVWIRWRQDRAGRK